MITELSTEVKGDSDMPLNDKGQKILGSMIKQYGAKKGKSVFYASENSGKIKGVTKKNRLGRTLLKRKI